MILKNFWRFVRRNKTVFILFAAVQISIVVAFLSVFNYAMKTIEDFKEDEKQCRTYSVSIGENYSEKSELDNALGSFAKRYKDMLSEFYVSTVSGKDSVRAEYIFDTKKVVTVGEGFDRRNFESGKKEALAVYKFNPEDTNISDVKIGDTYELFGEDYKIIGSTLESEFIVPYSSLTDIVKLSSICMVFNKDLSSVEVKILEDDIQNILGGGNITYPDLYPTNMYVSAIGYISVFLFVMLVAIMNIVYLYSYMMNRRRHETAVLRICGCSVLKVSVIYLSENLLISLCTYVIGMLLHIFCVMPVMKAITTEIGYYITPVEYICIFIAVLIVQTLAFIPTMTRIAHTSPSVLTKE